MDIPLEMAEKVGQIIESEGYTVHNITFKPFLTKGGNYASVLFELDIKGETKSGHKETNLFIKQVPPYEFPSFIKSGTIFANEIFFYKELNKIYIELQNEASIPQEERFLEVKCFYADNTLIILENLSRKGYETLHRTKVPSLRFNERCLEQLAKFHALSFVLQNKRPEYFENNIKVLEMPQIYDDNWRLFYGNAMKMSADVLEGETKTKVEKMLPQLLENMRKYYTENESVVRCLCHGDFRPNNVLMLAKNSETSQVVTVDYQVLYYGCPVMDFLYFISFASDRNMRQNHLEYLKDVYHNNIGKFLEYFNMDVEDVYPRKEFESTFKDRYNYMLTFSLIRMIFTYIPEDDVPDLKDIADVNVNLDVAYKKTVNELTDIIDIVDV